MARTAGLLVALAVAAAPGARAEPGPFDVLEWDRRAGIVTSRNGQTVWLSLAADGHVVRLPGHAGALRGKAAAPVLGATCRAGAGSEAQGEIYLADHPEQPDAYTVLDPMFWILGLTGGAEERWPVAVRIGCRISPI